MNESATIWVFAAKTEGITSEATFIARNGGSNNRYQFEQQVRAVCGLPLGGPPSCVPRQVNLLGDIWHSGEPAWEKAIALPDVKLHLYGKREPRAGRKMGHLTALAESPQIAAKQTLAARRALVTL